MNQLLVNQSGNLDKTLINLMMQFCCVSVYLKLNCYCVQNKKKITSKATDKTKHLYFKYFTCRARGFAVHDIVQWITGV